MLPMASAPQKTRKKRQKRAKPYFTARKMQGLMMAFRRYKGGAETTKG
jgi:hypothetical protein